MICSPNIYRVTTRLTGLLPRCSQHLVSPPAKIIITRYASNQSPYSGRKLQRDVPLTPRILPRPPRPRQIRSLTKDFEEATDDVTQERLFEQYINTPVESVSGKPQSVADVLLNQTRRSVRSSFVYAGLVGVLIFGGAAVLSQADKNSLIRATPGSNPSIKDLRATRERREMSAAQRSVDALRKYLDKGILQYYAQWRLAYLNASDGKKAAYMIAGVNIAVCIAWQVSSLALRSPRLPNFVPFMMRWFLHTPLAHRPLERAITPITHTFSHNSIMHLLFNNFCMLSFATSAGWYISSQVVQSGGKFEHGYREPQELSGTYHFLAFFVTAGVFASLGSTLHAQFLQKRVLQSLHPTLNAYRKTNIPGLGASGAVYSVLVVSALADPDAKIGIAILTNVFPFLNTEKKYGMTALIGLDIFGLLAGWTTFGHAAHLGGAAFGAAYYYFGPRMWATIRGPET